MIYKKLRDLGAAPAAIALTSLGLAVGLRGLIQFIWGTDSTSFPRESKLFWDLPFKIKIPPDMFFCAIVAFIIAIAFYFVLFKTKLGKAIRATSDNPDLARITGINTEKIILYIWFIGGILPCYIRHTYKCSASYNYTCYGLENINTIICSSNSWRYW
ncbi:MAG: hypothetical protein Ct9H90mP2_07150 [Dehalococcoidia bacterium]|nr:MAG: hypothetical protein Ct9H90mP2_07150 [Dehalococcoidia bacterium]